MRLVMASANPHKAVEIAAVLREAMADVEIVPRPPGLGDVAEDGETLEANALIKARFVCAAAGEPAIADDTGLEVDALGGVPGVHSARYAGPEQDAAANLAKLLTALQDMLPPQRRARFRTVVTVVFPDGRDVLADGAVEGCIAAAPRGDGGFGYDPVFVADEAPLRTFAELTSDEKNSISHRGRALRALAAKLQQLNPAANRG
ncbi:RdgB/HAM1 family non-canonical purine NTP pyrophosphatase [Candidatus Poriferisodalis sp.]|uniref:RdgB/HAM1 family non-canonical purine NTP pyrophosphatase n=1 Tax=Candidatus Poriferisodalis sp. TaxID=3101277 RepID=UPI003B0135D3